MLEPRREEQEVQARRGHGGRRRHAAVVKGREPLLDRLLGCGAVAGQVERLRLQPGQGAGGRPPRPRPHQLEGGPRTAAALALVARLVEQVVDLARDERLPVLVVGLGQRLGRRARVAQPRRQVCLGARRQLRLGAPQVALDAVLPALVDAAGILAEAQAVVDLLGAGLRSRARRVEGDGGSLDRLDGGRPVLLDEREHVAPHVGAVHERVAVALDEVHLPREAVEQRLGARSVGHGDLAWAGQDLLDDRGRDPAQDQPRMGERGDLGVGDAREQTVVEPALDLLVLDPEQQPAARRRVVHPVGLRPGRGGRGRPRA